MPNQNKKISISRDELKDFLLHRRLSVNLERLVKNLRQKEPHLSYYESVEILLDLNEELIIEEEDVNKNQKAS